MPDRITESPLPECPRCGAIARIIDNNPNAIVCDRCAYPLPGQWFKEGEQSKMRQAFYAGLYTKVPA